MTFDRCRCHADVPGLGPKSHAVCGESQQRLLYLIYETLPRFRSRVT